MALIEKHTDRLSKATYPGTLDKRGSVLPPITAQTPKRNPESHKGRDFILSAATVGILATGAGIVLFNSQEQDPQPSQYPGGIVEPSNSPFSTPFSTESPVVVIPSESPTESPIPLPTARPKATLPPPPPSPKESFKNIETVPLKKDGNIEIDGRGIIINNGTVVAKNENPDGTIKNFAVTVPGKKITRNQPISYIPDSTYGGITIWVTVTDRMVWGFQDTNTPLVYGSAEFSDYIAVGNSINYMIFPIIENPGYPSLNKDISLNKTTIKEINNEVGQHISRSNKIFTLNSDGILIK